MADELKNKGVVLNLGEGYGDRDGCWQVPRPQVQAPASQEKHLSDLQRTGAHTTSEMSELFGVARPAVYRAVQRGAPS